MEDINIDINAIESKLDLAQITVKHGLHSFRYGTSAFLDKVFECISLSEKDVFYDLGSGYGLVLAYGAQKFPQATFKGIEILEERYTVSQELKEEYQLQNVTFIQKDMFSYDFSDGSVFYINNPLFEDMYDRLFEKLKDIAKSKEITIIAESRTTCFDDQSWLQKQEYYAIDVQREIAFYKSISNL